MSKFNNPRVLQAGSATLDAAVPPGVSAVESNAAPASAQPAEALRRLVTPSAVQRIGFVMLSVYLLSGYANDLTNHLFHTKAYLSNISELLLPFLLLASGAAFFRSLRTKEGKVWLFYMAWLIIDIPFSVWRGGSFNAVIMNWLPRNWILFYYVTAFTVTRAQLGRLMRVQIAASLLLLLSCFAFGSADGSRFAIEGSLFFGNANELAMQVLFGITALFFLVYVGKLPLKIFAIAGIGFSLLYVLKTGSRGGLLGAIALALVVTDLSRRKILILLITGALVIPALVFVSPETLNRLKLAFSQPDMYSAKNDDERSAIASRLQREELLRQSRSEER